MTSPTIHDVLDYLADASIPELEAAAEAIRRRAEQIAEARNAAAGIVDWRRVVAAYDETVRQNTTPEWDAESAVILNRDGSCIYELEETARSLGLSLGAGDMEAAARHLISYQTTLLARVSESRLAAQRRREGAAF